MFILQTLLQLAFAATSIQAGASDFVQLPTGRYIGLHDLQAGARVYYNIPYGTARRFEAPQPLVDGGASNTLVNASSRGPACINFHLPAPFNTDKGLALIMGDTPIEPQVENCLSMDVYVPDGQFRQPLPVLVFIPGGGFLVAASFTYDFRPLLERGVKLGKPFIAVTMNYRLGPLGQLNPSTATADEINLGLRDQRLALLYVQKHIHAFGGDPREVIISGQSAGAESAMHHILWPGNETLFRGVWAMSLPSSGQPALRKEFDPNDELIARYAVAVGCPPNQTLADAISCLQISPVPALVDASEAWEGKQLSLGGGSISENVFKQIRAGNYLRVPMVLAACRDECTSTALGFKSDNDETTAIAGWILANSAHMDPAQSVAFVEELMAAYPNDPTIGCPYDGQNTTYGQPSQFKRMSAIMTDSTYTEPLTEYLDTFSTTQNVWGIEWAQAVPGADVDPAYGVMHGSDLFFYFPRLGGDKRDPRLHGQAALVHQLQDALATFVTDLTPQSKGGSYKWPAFAQERKITSFGSHGAQSVDVPRRPGFDVIREGLRPEDF